MHTSERRQELISPNMNCFAGPTNSNAGRQADLQTPLRVPRRLEEQKTGVLELCPMFPARAGRALAVLTRS
eukprot:6732803-Pyramimonas_sp.AAC.1